MLYYLSIFISWLDDQKAGTQLLVGIVITIAIGVLGRLLEASVRFVWKEIKAVARKWRDARKPLEVPRTKIGLYDHVINAQLAAARLPPAMEAAMAANQTIVAKLTKAAEAIGPIEDIHKRRRLIGELVKSTRRDVVDLMKIARSVADDSELVVTSYRSMLTKANVETFADRVALVAEREKFQRLGEATNVALNGIGVMQGTMPGLVNIAPELGVKHEAALQKLRSGFESVNAFCLIEVPVIVRHRSGRLARAVAFLKPPSTSLEGTLP